MSLDHAVASAGPKVDELLEPLRAAGWTVLHDLAVPGSRANIAHVVVGRTGVALIESRTFSDELWIRSGALGHGRFPLRGELEAIRFEAKALQEVVSRVEPSVVVRAVVCIHGTDVPEDPTRQLAPIVLCGPAGLVAELRRPRSFDELDPAQIEAVARAIEAGLPRRAWVPEASARPARAPRARGRSAAASAEVPADTVSWDLLLHVLGVLLLAILACVILPAVTDRVNVAPRPDPTITVPVEPPAVGADPAG